VIEKYKTCPFNKTKSKIEAYELGVVWKYANNGSNLNGAHDSLIDVRAQTDILTHSCFVPFIDRASSIQPIDEIFSRTLQNEWKKNMEPTRPVHVPWVELTKEHNIKWEPSWQDKYTGPQGGHALFSLPFFRWYSLRESLNSQRSIATMIGLFRGERRILMETK
jgi:hypothetical protein